MLPTERRRKILTQLEENDFLKLKALKESLQISMETLRRDVQHLVNDDLITKEYGGIRLKHHSNGESIIEQRLDLNLHKKNTIALKAIAEICDGDCIFLDSGSTTLQIAKHLDHRENLTIITNSIPVMLQALNQGHTIISIGGKVRQSEHSITSFDFLFNFDQLNIDKAFICCSGISLQKGVTDYNLEEVETRRKILNISKKSYLTTDSTKINKVVTVKICDIDALDVLVSDDELNSDLVNQLSKKITIL